MADDNFDYKRLQLQERITSVQAEQYRLEQQHYQCRIQILMANDQGTVDANLQRATELERQIKSLREEEDALTAQTEDEPASS